MPAKFVFYLAWASFNMYCFIVVDSWSSFQSHVNVLCCLRTKRTQGTETQGQRWPEDLTWHPNGDSVFSTYTADSGDSQISLFNLNKNGKASVTFLEDKPHERGVINSMRFMPWDDTCFVTGGTDHAVVLWKEKETGNAWKPTALHQKKLHTSSVTGIAGMQQKTTVLSVGADKRNHRLRHRCWKWVFQASDRQ